MTNSDHQAQDRCARELFENLSPEVRAVGAPPIPVLPEPWRLVPARADGTDLDLVHGWMNSPQVAPFWQQAWPRERWAAELRTQLAGNYCRPFLLLLNERPIGYIELYRAARDVVAHHYPALPHDTGLHGAIGEPDLIGRGLAYRIWLHMIEAVFAADPHCRRMITDPAADHQVARRLDAAVARKVGGAELGEVELPHKRAALYIYPRTPADLPCSSDPDRRHPSNV
ncbi:RimJ/RimL family protein N-acetyltransferase [Tamaricihabitans halophyticus]|uniref:Lysine N-acyltransferase MbtK n=1 Tax=Tamaricihabitans halophyticus TaxID=1262583 RepID=A0A4R2QDV5_9PSEU|nr:GNAT family N-acetyltransferase [Tamaricihabitans halophyticus]TCP45115.1 RimJ/RimL family protein N-acetyltransferase [Tamaricihabitans halophyticus]